METCGYGQMPFLIERWFSCVGMYESQNAETYANNDSPTQ